MGWTNLGRIYVDDVEDGGDEGPNAEETDGEVAGMTAADLCKEAEQTGTEEEQTERPLSAEGVDHCLLYTSPSPRDS